ncbi:protein serine/threonine phosphatase 2C [Vararia minispora EC-137]|uniref:Protein serine/threonine phosphatase 2C n=1 Tax=Vararia minispora EC-137 TaxID=1314806 RepID=A0ACB8QGQ8_9AGAM|nr:protein serine/threonine phosphatase 2C [Vararia minispora EC-137]
MGRGGHRRWTYRILPEPTLSNELRRMSNAFSKGHCDGVLLQPSPLHEFRNQDRAYTESWPTPSGAWTFNAVFDGHVGHATVDHAVASIPNMVRRSLQDYLHACRGAVSPDTISKILSDAITTFDSALLAEFVALFPGGVAGLQRMSDSQIRWVLQNRPNASQASIRCLHGSTALLSLTDPTREHIWICNLGDCQAVLATRGATGRWQPAWLSTLHDGENASELARIAREHPGERDALEHNRVIGFLGPTRSLGDAWLKLPAIYSQRVLAGLRDHWIVRQPETYISRVRTPPYVSSTPDVVHLPLPRSAHGRRHALLLCSDGLPDLYEARFVSRQDMAAHWARVIGGALDGGGGGSGSGGETNAALALLRDALGGSDIRAVSQNLTVEMEERWMDDVTVLVQRL